MNFLLLLLVSLEVVFVFYLSSSFLVALQAFSLSLTEFREFSLPDSGPKPWAYLRAEQQWDHRALAGMGNILPVPR